MATTGDNALEHEAVQNATTINLIFQAIIAFVAVLPATIAALAGLYQSMRANDNAKQAVKLTEVGNKKVDEASALATEKADETHRAVNGRVEQLVQIARDAAYSEGLADGLKKAIDDKSRADVSAVQPPAIQPPTPPQTP